MRKKWDRCRESGPKFCQCSLHRVANNEAGIEYLRQKSERWAELTFTGHLPRRLAWDSLNTTILKTLTYPLNLTEMTFHEWIGLMLTVLVDCQSYSGKAVLEKLVQRTKAAGEKHAKKMAASTGKQRKTGHADKKRSGSGESPPMTALSWLRERRPVLGGRRRGFEMVVQKELPDPSCPAQTVLPKICGQWLEVGKGPCDLRGICTVWDADSLPPQFREQGRSV